MKQIGVRGAVRFIIISRSANLALGTDGGEYQKYRMEVEIRTVAGKTNLQKAMAYFRLTRGNPVELDDD